MSLSLVPAVVNILRTRGMHVFTDSRGRECVCLKHAAELLGVAPPAVKYYVETGRLTWEQHATPVLGERSGQARRIIPIAALIRIHQDGLRKLPGKTKADKFPPHSKK